MVFTNGKMKIFAGMLIFCIAANVFVVNTFAANESVKYTVQREDYSVYNSDGSYVLARYYDKIVIDSSYAYADKINAAIQADFEEFTDSSDFDSALQWAEDDPPSNGHNYWYTVDSEVSKNDSGILSIKEVQKWYMGGGSYVSTFGFNFDLNTGEKLNISNVFSAGDAETSAYLRNCVENYDYPFNDYFGDDYKELVQGYGLSDYIYYIDGDNVILCYNTGSTAGGCITVSCPIVSLGSSGNSGSSADNDITGYWISESYTDSWQMTNSESIRLYTLKIESAGSGRISGVFIRNSTHFRDQGCKFTFTNLPVNGGGFSFQTIDVWTVPLSQGNNSNRAEMERNYTVTFSDGKLHISNAEGAYNDNTLIKCTQQEYDSASGSQTNITSKDYSDYAVQQEDTAESTYEDTAEDTSEDTDENINEDINEDSDEGSSSLYFKLFEIVKTLILRLIGGILN